MKIAVWYNFPLSGAKRALYHHVRGLVERGHSVEAWCPSTNQPDHPSLSDFITEHVEPFAWNPRRPQGRLHELYWLYRKMPQQMRAMQLHCRRCAEQINSGGYDVLFANTCMFFSAPLICRYVNIPTILYLQEPYRALYEANPILPWIGYVPSGADSKLSSLENRLRRSVLARQAAVQARFELCNARAAGAILVNSFFSRENVARSYGLDSKVCYLGVDTELFQPMNLARQPFVVSMGQIAPAKGVDRAIRALATIEKRLRPDLIWIANVSDARYRQEMEALAASLGVNFIPQIEIPDKQVVELLNRAAAMIYTSRLEPFGLAPLEANACETPVVAIAEGGVRETIQHGINGLLINDDDAIALGAAVLCLLQRPEQAREMGALARAYVMERWTWKTAVERLEHYLQIEASKNQPYPIGAVLQS